MAPGPLPPPFATRPALLALLGAILVVGAGVAFAARRVPPAEAADRASIDRLAVPYHHTAMRAPLVTRIDADAQRIRPGKVVTLSCQAAEVDGEPNQFRWLGPFGRTEESGSPSVRWTPAAPGRASISCIARNHIGTSVRTIDFDVVGDAAAAP